MFVTRYSPCTRLRPAAFLLFWFAALRVAWAQNAATLQAFEKEPHLGSVEEALVGVTVVNREANGNVQTRHGNGVMLRCDGFVLVPEALFYTANGGNTEAKPNQSVVVTLHPGTAQQEQVRGRRPGWFGWVEWGNSRQHLGYAVLKLDNVHCPAMRPLMPDTLGAGDKLALAWSAWNEAQQKFMPAQTRQVAVGERKPPTPEDKTPPLYREQFTPLRSVQEAVMAGAIVFTEEDLIVGIVPGSAPANISSFANFASLHRATNCVTPLPSGEVAFANRNKPPVSAVAPFGSTLPAVPFPAFPNAGQPPVKTSPAEKLRRNVSASAPDMVAVPGGPVKLPSELVKLQLDMEASSVACIAPFLIDRFEVTNAQYWEFWKSLPEKMRQDANIRADMYPYGWGKEAEPFPATLAQVPVLGVRLPGARAYAKWAGKRLPTPYEWSLAAFGPSGGNEMPEWGKRYLKHRKDVWNEIVKAHVEYAQKYPQIVPKFMPSRLNFREGRVEDVPVPRDEADLIKLKYHGVGQDVSHPSLPEFFHLPWFFYSPDFQEASAWSKKTVEELTEPLFQEWVDPMYVLPVGSRSYDVSPYGACDMLTNAQELVVPGPIFPWNKPPRADWPAREVDRYMAVQWGLFDWGTVQPTIYQYIKLDSWSGIGGLGKWTEKDYVKLFGGLKQLMEVFPFAENPLHLWSGTPRTISPDFEQKQAPLDTPTSLYDTPCWIGEYPLYNFLQLPKYTDHMPTRRLRAASENARPNTTDFAPSDLGSFVRARAAMDEYSELLRPATEMMVMLQAGPTYNMVNYPFIGATLHNWGYVQHPVVERLPKGGFKVTYPYPASWEDRPTFVNGTWITHAGAFNLWNERPRHYHQEMGHAVAEDQSLPISYAKLAEGTRIVPDTFLVAGGFRCAR